jgi:hypothetical protein
MPKRSKSVFKENFKLLHDGLSQTSTRVMTFDNDIHGPTCMKVTTCLPPFVLPAYWMQYGLSSVDIDNLATPIPAQYYWLSVLVHGVDIVATCLKPSLATAEEIIFTHRKDAIKLLIEHQDVAFKNKHSTLDMTSSDSMSHVPPLPLQEIDSSTVPAIESLLAPKLRAFQFNQVKGLYHLPSTKQRYLPVRVEGNSFFLQRATPYENYERSQKRQKYGCATIPLLVQTPDKHLFALCEDGLLVSSKTI